MKNFSNYTNSSNNNYTSYFDKRKELRKKAKLNSPIWSSPSTSENESPEDLYKSFFKTNFYFQEEIIKKEVPIDNKIEYTLSDEDFKNYKKSDSRNNSDEESENSNDSLTKIDQRILGKKTHREDDGNISQLNDLNLTQDNNLNNFNATLNELSEFLKPKPIEIKFNEKEIRRITHGTKLKKRELELYAPYIKNGKRIPRRGEVGLSSEAINNYEKLGYVMSGNRHKKMNIARESKEIQIFTVEEKKALAIFNLEEQQRKEINIINNFKKILKSKKDDEMEDNVTFQDKVYENDDYDEN